MKPIITGRSIWTALLLLALAGFAAPAASADTVYTVGGGSYKGKVQIEGDRVIVVTGEVKVTLDRDNVLRIEPGDDLGTQLADKQSRLDSKDAEGHYRLGQWALQNNLPGPARDLFQTAVRIQPDHVAAQLALGRVYLDGAWLDWETFGDYLRQWIANGLDVAALAVGRQALAGLMPPANRRAVLELTATAARRVGYFAESSAYYRELASMLVAGDPQFERTAASIDLLKDNPGGIYLVAVDELARAVGAAGRDDPRSGNSPKATSSDEPDRSGYYSLADDAVMEQALRDRAKELIGQGQGLMNAAQGQLASDPAKAVAGFKQADDLFGRADAIDSGIARSYRVEVRRRMIQMRQTSAESLALRFDAVMKTFPPNKSVAEYRAKMKLGQSLVEDVQKELETILGLAGPYPQEFSAIIAWAQQDLMTAKAMRHVLDGELDATAGAGRSGPP